MFRGLFFVVAAVSMLASSCSPPVVKCGDLCIPGEKDACMNMFTCVSPGKCQVVTDAGPNSCP